MFNVCVSGRLLACMPACVADMAEEKRLIIYMVLTMDFILSAVLEWRPTNGVVYTFHKIFVKLIFFRFLFIKQVTLSNYYKFPML